MYWDQALVLVQVGLLDRTLPVLGGETVAQVLDPARPMNELIRRALDEIGDSQAKVEPTTGGSPMPTDANQLQAPPDAELLRLIFGKNVSMAIAVVAKLRVADLLADGRRPSPTWPQGRKHTRRRSIGSCGPWRVSASSPSRPIACFALTPMGEYLRTGVRGSLRGIADLTCSDWSWRPWSKMLETVRTGLAAFDSVFGESVFDYLGKHLDESAVFNEGMTGFTSNVAPAVAEASDFAAFETVVDVGGGHGVLLTRYFGRIRK